jgi:peptidoglycan/LPS O-acetylase OafA/YrhL
VIEASTAVRNPSLTSRPASPGSGATAKPGAATSDVTRRHGSAWSAEVQALRAVAVLLVLAFHVWPDLVPGGYVGVDVFFVISGFLITGHIVRDLDGRRFGLGRFYVRRARRLLPAALLVLLTVSLVVVLTQPYTKWVTPAQQILASAGYVQNWVLAGTEVDYLSPVIPPTPVQHFWSLSVEEQFYFVWPVLLLATAWLTRHRRRRVRRIAVGSVMLAVTVVSLGYGLWATATDPAGAYFFSTTRMWEFSVGGLLALAMQSGIRAVGDWGHLPSPQGPGDHHVLAGVLSWAGLAAIAASAMLYTERTAFPGYAALLPVAGALAVLAAGPVRGLWSPAPLVRLRATQLVGDMSYSLYLWHWPLIVLFPLVVGDPGLGRLDRVCVLVLAFVLSWLSLTLVENRFRSGRPDVASDVAIAGDADGDRPARPGVLRRLRRPGAAVVIGALTAGVVAVAGGAWLNVHGRVADARAAADRAFAAGTPCFGGTALVDPSCEPPLGDLVTPNPAGAVDDLKASVGWRECFASREATVMHNCTFGPADADFHLVLFGDSHALQWFSAVREISRTRGWRLTTVLRASCTPNSAYMIRKPRAEAERCHNWALGAIDKIAADPTVDAVVTTAYNNKTWEPDGELDGYQAGIRGYRDAWARFAANGAQVVVLRDTPRPLGTMLRCVAETPSGEGCDRARTAATARGDKWGDRPDAMLVAAEQSPQGVPVLDLTDAFCTKRRCPAVIGNVLVYADSNHMTPTFSRSLVPVLEERLSAALKPAASDS